ncbi:MAK10-like protein [Tanacetum coccineum]
MENESPRRTLGDYSKPSHEGYRNTIEIPDGNNVVPLRSDTIRLVQNGFSFHGLGSIFTWEDLTNRFLSQFFPPGRTSKLCNDILTFQQHEAVGGKLRDRNDEESWALLEDLTLYDNESWNDPRDFAKLVKVISMPQDVPSTSDRHLIKLENQIQCLMEAHLAPNQPIQVNKIASSCKICSGPHNTQYCMENPEQAFVDYASLCSNEVGGKPFTNNQGPRNFNKATNA